MLDKLDFMVRFWRLRARHEALEKPLSAFERAELLSLLQLMATDEHLPKAGPPPRSDMGLPVQIMAPGGFILGEIRLVCPEGIVVACKTTMRAGQSIIVRMADAIAGVEFTLPCVVDWAYTGVPGALSSMAFRVDGIPTRTTFAMPELGLWRSSFVNELSPQGRQ